METTVFDNVDAWLRLAVAVTALLAVLPLEASGNAEVSASTSASMETEVTSLVAGMSSQWLKKSICLLYQFLCKGNLTCKIFSVFGTILVIHEIFFQMVFACLTKDEIYVTIAKEVHTLVTKCKALTWCNAQYVAFYEIILAWIPCLKAKLGLLSSVLTGLGKTVDKLVDGSLGKLVKSLL